MLDYESEAAEITDTRYEIPVTFASTVNGLFILPSFSMKRLDDRSVKGQSWFREVKQRLAYKTAVK